MTMPSVAALPTPATDLAYPRVSRRPDSAERVRPGRGENPPLSRGVPQTSLAEPVRRRPTHSSSAPPTKKCRRRVKVHRRLPRAVPLSNEWRVTIARLGPGDIAPSRHISARGNHCPKVISTAPSLSVGPILPDLARNDAKKHQISNPDRVARTAYLIYLRN